MSTIGGRKSKLSKQQFDELLGLLEQAADILGETVSGPRMFGVLVMVEDLPYDQLRDVLATWPKNHDWFPKPSQIVDAVVGRQSVLDDAAAEVAWHRALDCAERWSPDGEYEYPSNSGLTDRDKFALRSVGGLERISNLSTEGADHSFARRDFVHAWKISCFAFQPGLKALPENDSDEKYIVVRGSDGGIQSEEG